MTTTAATHIIPPALITHCTASLRGRQEADISVFHARSADARIAITFSGVLLVIYSCQAAQGLLEAFTAARGHLAQVPRELPSPRGAADEPAARVALSIEWTRRPEYAVVAQSALNKLRTAKLHWVELYTGPITWQIRDQVALLSTLELLNRVHRTAIAVFLDSTDYAADPAGPDYRSASADAGITNGARRVSTTVAPTGTTTRRNVGRGTAQT